LFNHRFCKDFYFRSNLYRSDLTSTDRKVRQSSGFSIWNAFTKRPIASSRINPAYRISSIQNPIASLNPGCELLRPAQSIEILRQADRYRIAEAGVSMPIDRPVEQALKAV